MDERLKEYRSHLVTAEQKAQEDFDKTVLSLSGGALGISFAFIRDVVGSGSFISPELLFAAWVCWGASVTAVLASYFTSHLALRHTLRQLDAHDLPDQRVGGIADIVTAVLNAIGGVLFLVGIITIVLFVRSNLEF